MVYDPKRIYANARKNYYKNSLKKFKESKLSKRNKEIVFEFSDSLFSTGVGDLRVAKVLMQLKNIIN